LAEIKDINIVKPGMHHRILHLIGNMAIHHVNTKPFISKLSTR